MLQAENTPTSSDIFFPCQGFFWERWQGLSTTSGKGGGKAHLEGEVSQHLKKRQTTISLPSEWHVWEKFDTSVVEFSRTAASQMWEGGKGKQGQNVKRVKGGIVHR